MHRSAPAPPHRPRSTALRRIVAPIGLAGAVLLAGGCSPHGSGGADAVRCAEPFREALDPASTQHLFPETPEPRYLSDPPTSGPHRLGDRPTGVLTVPIPRPVQVAMLEVGDILIQYRPSLSPAEVAVLADVARAAGAPIAGSLPVEVTVAPNPDLPAGAAVVATSWGFKVVCSDIDRRAVEAFVNLRAGHSAANP